MTTNINEQNQTATAPGILEPNRVAFTSKEVAKILGVGRTTLWKLARLGYLKPLPGVGRLIYSRSALLNYLDGKAKA